MACAACAPWARSSRRVLRSPACSTRSGRTTAAGGSSRRCGGSGRSDFDKGVAWLRRDTLDPRTGTGKVRITVQVGRAGAAGCLVAFRKLALSTAPTGDRLGSADPDASRTGRPATSTSRAHAVAARSDRPPDVRASGRVPGTAAGRPAHRRRRRHPPAVRVAELGGYRGGRCERRLHPRPRRLPVPERHARRTTTPTSTRTGVRSSPRSTPSSRRSMIRTGVAIR